jgi:glycosyltransferase involved in cell wall biosynthesis
LVVLIPVYRNQAGLDRTLRSLSLAEGDFDVVVVDDGSPQPLTMPAELRSGITINRIRLEQNAGISRALNRGLDFIFSRGYQYIARLDSDDRVAPYRFEMQVTYLDDHNDCAAVSSFIEFVNEKGDVLFCHRAPTTWNEIAREMRVRNCLLHSGVMLRATAILEAGPYDERFCGAEDYELFLRLSRQHPLAVLPQVLTFVQYNLSGLSVRGRRRQQLSRLRCQLRHFDLSDWHCVFGLLRTLTAILVPQAAVIFWKRARAH